jgi:hypothetical protein
LNGAGWLNVQMPLETKLAKERCCVFFSTSQNAEGLFYDAMKGRGVTATNLILSSQRQSALKSKNVVPEWHKFLSICITLFFVKTTPL